MRRRMLIFVLLAVVLAGCSQAAAPAQVVVVTRTPRPTFTPTTVAATATRTVPSPTPLPSVTPVASATAIAPTATALPPTATPPPAKPVLTSDSAINVRSGPAVAFNLLGQLAPGQQYDVTGKNPGGDWWQINFNGQTGWVSAGLVSANSTASTVAVAANIPAAPTAAPAPVAAQPPAPAPAPAPAQPPAPTTRFGSAGMEARDADNTNFNIVTFWGRLGSPSATPPDDAGSYKLRVSAPSGSVEVPFSNSWQIAYSGQRDMEFRYNAKAELPRVAGSFRAVIIDGGGSEVSEAITGNLNDRTHDAILTWLPR